MAPFKGMTLWNVESHDWEPVSKEDRDERVERFTKSREMKFGPRAGIINMLPLYTFRSPIREYEYERKVEPIWSHVACHKSLPTGDEK